MDYSEEFSRRYEILELLGAGGMGKVLLARDRVLARTVAIKFLTAANDPTANVRERFYEEARVCAALRHENIVPLYAYDFEGTSPYLVFQYVKGRTLADEIRQRKALPSGEVLRIADAILSGLHLAHQERVIHRDLKPANIMLRAEDGEPMILDFGMAKSELRDDFRTRRGLILGTPLYMAPELISKGVVDARTDLYALGCTLYECLAGRPPFIADSEMKVVRLQMSTEVAQPIQELRPDVDPSLGTIVRLATEKDPTQRFQSADQMRNWVRCAQEGRPLPARLVRPTGPSPAQTQFRQRSRTLMRLLLPRTFPSAVMVGLSMLGLVLVVGFLAARIVGWTDASDSLRVVVSPSGVAKLSWETTLPVQSTVLLQEKDAGGSGGTRTEKESTARQVHHLEVAGLEPGARYALSVANEAGEVSWSRTVRVPEPGDVTVTYGVRNAIVGLSMPAAQRARLISPGREPRLPAALDPGHGSMLEFDVPLEPYDRLERVVLEVDLETGETARYPLDPLTGTAARLESRLTSFDRKELIQAIVKDAGFDRNLEWPQLDRMFKGSGRGRDHDETDFEPREIKRKSPDGHFHGIVQAHLVRNGLWADLEGFSGIAPEFFADPRQALSAKRSLFHAIQRLEPVEMLLRYQRESRDLVLNRLYETFITFDWRILSDEQERRVASEEHRLELWTRPDYSQWSILGSWLRAMNFVTRLKPDYRNLRDPDLPGMAAYRRLHELGPVARDPAAHRATLRMLVAFLGPAYAFEVTMRSPGGGEPFRILLRHPGKPGWYEAMDGRPGRRRNPDGPPRTVAWGEIEARFPIALLPPDPIQLEVEYRIVPDVSSGQVSLLHRSALTRQIWLGCEPEPR